MKVDLLLLENQLPFVVLQQIFPQAFPPARQHNEFPSLLELTFNYFAYYNTREIGYDNVGIIEHFTDMHRIFSLPNIDRLPGRSDRGEREIHLHTATELVEAGLELKVDDSISCLFDLQFEKRCSKGFLKFPRFKVDGATEILFRNLLALEQCHYPHEAYVTDYIRILELLINTGKDVDLLVKNGIMTIGLGDNNAVADLFNSLLKNITPINFIVNHLDLYKDLKEFHDNRRNRWRESLKRDYCSTPCHFLASFAVFVLLLFSATQIVLSILNLRKKK
ncbi:hypothetical protein O6P43_014667 [Quillaja saponaria]|uniref:Uncharacterized protein n=1 Tax=Quillaja saponaria TaxID=32244 RepID=A0AAD7LVH9_QUISA|nr:hypothetical protein O6P43_014667 [Quillaja saponaria]